MGSGASSSPAAVIAAIRSASDEEIKVGAQSLPEEKRQQLVHLLEEQIALRGRLASKDSGQTAKDPKDAGWIDCDKINAMLQQPLKIFSAIDGTDPSLCSFEYVVKELMQHDKNTSLQVMHLYDDAKNYLPPKYRREHLESFCDSLCTSYLRKDRFKITMVARTPEEKVGTRLAKEAAHFGADFLVMGFYGRKGKKEHSAKLFASNVMEIIQRGQCSTIAFRVDDTKAIPQNRKVKFVVSVSLNAAATKAFLDALRLSKAEDEIHVVYIKQYDEDVETEGTRILRKKYAVLFAKLKDDAEEALSKFGDRTAVFHMLKKPKGDTTAEAVCHYAESISADFVGVGTNALRVQRGKPILGSVSMAIALACPCSFIVSNYVSAVGLRHF